ncbi:pre-mRNA-splicing factor CWC22 homolog [Cydia fagiglandana]|uniref:pre-mRNA-splicing factor CWC22 homolog n=1 Tax=Cydia fagiglandana TaxID=1458189 RepID=UPI002FEE0516
MVGATGAEKDRDGGVSRVWIRRLVGTVGASGPELSSEECLERGTLRLRGGGSPTRNSKGRFTRGSATKKAQEEATRSTAPPSDAEISETSSSAGTRSRPNSRQNRRKKDKKKDKGEGTRTGEEKNDRKRGKSCLSKENNGENSGDESEKEGDRGYMGGRGVDSRSPSPTISPDNRPRSRFWTAEDDEKRLSGASSNDEDNSEEDVALMDIQEANLKRPKRNSDEDAPERKKSTAKRGQAMGAYVGLHEAKARLQEMEYEELEREPGKDSNYTPHKTQPRDPALTKSRVTALGETLWHWCDAAQKR